MNTSSFFFEFTRRMALILAAFGVLTLLPSCSWLMAKTSDDEVKEQEKEMGTPNARVTPYDDSLKQFGRLLVAYDIPSTQIMCKPILNQTSEAELPKDISTMMGTAITSVGNPIQYLKYDPIYLQQEFSTYSVTDASSRRISRLLPVAVIDGGITEYDKDLIEKERELRTKMKIGEGQWGSKYNYDGGAGYQASSSVSSMTLDLNTQNYVTNAAVPGTQTSNSIFTRKTNLGWAIGFYFQGCGGSFDYSYRAKQGRHYALRLLINLSVMQTLGNYLSVPYWRCLPNMAPDTELVQRTREFFEDCTDAERIPFVKSYMFLHGAPCFQIDGIGLDRSSKTLSPEEDVTVKDFMARNNCATQVDLLMKLWETVDFEKGRNQSRRYGKAMKEFNKLYEDANAELNKGKYAEARKICEEMSRRMPGNPDPKANMERIDAIMKEQAKNAQALAQAQSSQPAAPASVEQQNKKPPAKNAANAPLGLGNNTTNGF